MHTLEEIHEKLFSNPPVRSITFGSRKDKLPICAMLDDLTLDITLPFFSEDVSLDEQKIKAQGLCAFMLLAFEHEFERKFCAEEIQDYLDDQPIFCRHRILYLPRDVMMPLITNGTATISERPSIALVCADTEDVAFYFDVYPGETLFQIFFTFTPFPSFTGSR